MIFDQYAKMKRKGKYANANIKYDYMGALDKNDPDVYTILVKKNKYIVRLQTKIKDGNIQEIKFKAFACSIVMASMNMACEKIHKKPLIESLRLTNEEFKNKLKIPETVPERNSIMVEEVVDTLFDAIVSPDRLANKSYE